MPKKLIARAFVTAIAYLIFIDLIDCASIKRKRRKDEISDDIRGNQSLGSKQLKVNDQQSSFSEDSVAKAASVIKTSDTGNQKKFVVQNKKTDMQNDSHEGKKQLDNDIANAEMDPDSDDNDGAGAGIEDAENLEKVGVDHVIENIMNQDLSRKVLRGRSEDINKEVLQFRSNENNDKMFWKQQHESKDLANSSHAQPTARQRTSLIPLKMDELQMPDHVDGLRMEHDGHLNREYKKEVILGNHEEFEWDSESKLGDRLKDIFHRADINQDDKVDLDELQSWIMFNIQNHLDNATADNKRIFIHLDTNSDDFVTWQEFYIHFLLAKGHDLNIAEKQSIDYDTLSLDRNEKEVIIKYRFQWAEADEDPQDNRLTFDEFTNFRHPEQSKTMLSRMVKHLIDNFDKDGDEAITEEEFLMMSPDGESEANDEHWLAERRKVFREVIDINKDGIVNQAELKVYVDPHNANVARLEAENLINLADQDADGRLSLSEVLENAELFLGSKVVDTDRNFHDEF